MGSSDLAGLSAFDEVLAMGSTWPFLGDPTVASGGRQRTAPGGFDHQGPDAPSAHRRPGYPLSGCVPAEPDSVSPGRVRLASTEQCGKPPSDTGVMPQKILLSRCPTEKWPKVTHSLGRRALFPYAARSHPMLRRMEHLSPDAQSSGHSDLGHRQRTILPKRSFR